MSTPAPRQQLGRRLDLTPYYQVAHAAPGALELRSRPAANRPAGVARAILGGGLLLVAVVIIGAGLLTAAQGLGFATAAVSAAIGGLFASFGVQRLIGGYAIASTANQITIADGALTIAQTSRVGQPRSQQLPLAAIAGVRLHPRRIIVGTLARRLQPIAALELLVGDQVWIIDSAADPAALAPTIAALTAALDLPLAR